jgi:type IV pilus assembly protein PilB
MAPAPAMALADKLLAALANDQSANTSALAVAFERAASRGISPVRTALANGIALEALERAAWWHQGYDVADIDTNTIDASSFARFPIELARAYQALPLGRDAEGWMVAVADPDNLAVIDDVRRRFAPDVVRILVGDQQSIVAALAALEHRAASTEFIDEEESEAEASFTDESADIGEGKIAQMVTKTIEMAVSYRASDIHVEPAEDHIRVRIRVDGVLTEIARYPISIGQGFINQLKVRAGLDVAERRQPQDGRITATISGRTLDLRLVTLPTVWRCEGAVMRILDRSRSVVSLQQLGYSEHVMDTWNRLSASPYGALLATGPTGSGKTTSLYATLARIATKEVKVCTVEDPVEYRFPGVTQMQVDVKAGRTFASALRSFLRADPDIILVGEIRDTVTATIAVEASLTGHLLLASLHANTACTAPTRLIEMGIEPYLVGSAVRGVLSQRLVRKLCSACRTSIPTPALAFEVLGEMELPDNVYKKGDRGCARCSGTGYSGRIAIAEVLEVTDAIAHSIANGANALDLLALARTEGMVPMYEEGLHRVLEGTTSLEELARVIS